MQENLPNIRINGHPSQRLPNTVSVSFKDAKANKLIEKLSRIAVSPGAACHSEKVEISHVLEAMGVPEDYAAGTIRLSVGRDTSNEDIEFATEEISRAVSDLQSARKGYTKTYEEVKLTHYSHGLGCACKIQPKVIVISFIKFFFSFLKGKCSTDLEKKTST